MRIFRLRKRQVARQDPQRQRPDTRRWGPFSGGQLTIIIVTFALLLLAPVGAWAVAGSNVFVTDAVSGKQASVNAAGQLATSVSGAVTATQSPGNQSYHSLGLVGESQGCHAVTAAVPAGKALIVTSVSVNLTVTTGPVFVGLDYGTTSPCLGSTIDVATVSGSPASTSFSFSAGVPINTGHTVSMSLTSTSHDAAAFVYVHGYLVSATQCTGSASPVGCL